MIEVLRVLQRAGAHGVTKARIVDTIGNTSAPSVQRALDALRDHGADIDFNEKQRLWQLNKPFSMPLVAPDREDLIAVLIAEAILKPMADPELRQRLARLVTDLDARVRKLEPASDRFSLPRGGSLSATLTLGTRVKSEVLRMLLRTCARKVLRIEYDAPWKPFGSGRRSYDIEPWAVRVHDGAAYVRAWRRDVAAPRTFRVAEITSAKELHVDRLRHVPPAHEVWGDDHPAYGIDHDRPDTAVVRLRGAIARWVDCIYWHPDQKDNWIVEGELLERTLEYRSCRELARRIASVLDGVVSIAPESLRAEVESLVSSFLPPRQAPAPSPDDELPGVMHRVRPDETPPAAPPAPSPAADRKTSGETPSA